MFLVRIDQHFPPVHVVLEENLLAAFMRHLAVGHDAGQRRCCVLSRGARREGVEGVGVVLLEPRPGDVFPFQQLRPGLLADVRLVLFANLLAVPALAIGELVLGDLFASRAGFFFAAKALEPGHSMTGSVSDGFNRGTNRGQATGRDALPGLTLLPRRRLRLLFPTDL